jgi:predicted CXXCH cytochrome family protein
MDMRRKFILASIICLWLYVLMTVLEGCTKSSNKKESTDSTVSAPSTFVGSAACQSCHQREFVDWKLSDHYLAMQPVHDSTVLGDFDNATLKSDGVTSRFFRRDGTFFINTQGDDGANHDYEVQYVFGFFPLQQYLIAFPGGRLQSTRASWNSREKKWFNQYPQQRIHHKDWLHWTGNSQNWNTMCASCHSTNLQKNYEFASDSYSTTWKDINVGCESCHGAGSKHVAFVGSEEYKGGVRTENAALYYGKSSNSQLQLNTCAPCHSRKTDIAQDIMHTKEVMDDLIPQIISDDAYHGDGQIKEEDYEYGSFAQSKMFHYNVRCTNCHSPHTGKLIAEGNALCMNCHDSRYNTREHHFHEIETESSQCISCHMPMKTFMGNDHRRDHSFRVPRPDQSVVFETPNTCTSCHKGKSDKWAANAIRKWYGPTRAYHFSDDLLPGSLLTYKSEAHLLKLVGDTLQPEIARATAAHYLGSIQTPGSANGLLGAIADKKPLVRFHALRSLENFQSEWWIQKAVPALSDPVRAVRIAAADLFHQLPAEMIPTNARSVYQAANAENKKYLHYQTDFAVGNVMLADYELQENDHLNAISHYIRGLKKDSLMNYARLNLGAAYNSIGKNQEALKTLKDASVIDPKNERIYYNLGLLYYEMGDASAAMKSFQKCVLLNSTNAGLYYNYSLLLQEQGQPKKAEEILLKGYSINPQAIKVNYALAVLYANQNAFSKARAHAEILRKLDPDNPDYKGLFRALGM